ncbi:ankyrin, partial [Aspergillus phoenicis ATCC 13157]
GNLELVKLMLSRGADLEAKGANGETPLHIATSGGHIQVVQALLEAGADASAKDRYGDTLL